MPTDLPWVRFSSAAMEAALFRCGARTDGEIASFTVGMLAGIGGRPQPEQPAAVAGWEFGCELAREAVAYRERLSESGKRGNAKRWGCDQPASPPDRQGIATTRQDHTRPNSGGCISRSTVAPEAAAAAAEGSEDLFASNGRNPARSAPTHGKPHPEGDPAESGMMLASNAPLREPSLADMRVMHPDLLIYDADREAAATCLRLYGSAAWSRELPRLTAIAAKRPVGKQRVMLGELQQALAKTTKLAVEDFQRAGLPPPAWAVPQARLDAMTPQEVAAYGPPC